MNFKEYSDYYDLVYRTKDYKSEVEYILQLAHKFSNTKPIKSILNLGCGTGSHDFILAEKGLKVTGIDLSEGMLRQAKNKAAEKGVEIEFHIGDVRNVNLNQKFDLVISLFHVASYQNTNEDLLGYFKTAAKHLAPGGLFIFDFWYGPGVLTNKPETRIKRLAGNEYDLTRITEAEMYCNKNVVDVKYEIILQYRTGSRKILHEVHSMRYLFDPELELLMSGKFERLHSEEWMTGLPLSYESWNATYVCRNILESH